MDDKNLFELNDSEERNASIEKWCNNGAYGISENKEKTEGKKSSECIENIEKNEKTIEYEKKMDTNIINEKKENNTKYLNISVNNEIDKSKVSKKLIGKKRYKNSRISYLFVKKKVKLKKKRKLKPKNKFINFEGSTHTSVISLYEQNQKLSQNQTNQNLNNIYIGNSEDDDSYDLDKITKISYNQDLSDNYR